VRRKLLQLTRAETRHLLHLVECEEDQMPGDAAIAESLRTGTHLTTHQTRRLIDLLFEDDERSNFYGRFEDYVRRADKLKSGLLKALDPRVRA